MTDVPSGQILSNGMDKARDQNRLEYENGTVLIYHKKFLNAREKYIEELYKAIF